MKALRVEEETPQSL